MLQGSRTHVNTMLPYVTVIMFLLENLSVVVTLIKASQNMCTSLSSLRRACASFWHLNQIIRGSMDLWHNESSLIVNYPAHE